MITKAFCRRCDAIIERYDHKADQYIDIPQDRDPSQFYIPLGRLIFNFPFCDDCIEILRTEFAEAHNYVWLTDKPH